MNQVSLLEAEPEFGAALGPARREAAEARLRVPVITVREGPWRPPLENRIDDFGYLVLSGLLLRRVEIERGRSVELLAAGDCLLPWRPESASFSSAELSVVETVRLALLDRRSGSTLSRWPAVSAAITARAVDRSRRLALQAAIMSIVGIEQRLEALLWALAERWGRTGPAGTRVELNVPQAVLAEIVGARRPTVSKALGALVERDVLEARGPGCWLLKGEPPTAPG